MKTRKATTALNEDRGKPAFPSFNLAVSKAVDHYTGSLSRGSTAIHVATTYEDPHDDIDTECMHLCGSPSQEVF